MKEARHWVSVKDKKEQKDFVNCHLCPHNCVIAPDKYGICRVRKNIDGKLYSMVYARPVSTNIDPIEKKPLFHFLPGTDTYSFGTVGCNMRCQHCQNWEISQTGPENFPLMEVTPEQIVKMAVESKCPSISYTYTEPTINYEFVLDTAILARDEGLKNIMVTNGYINKEPLLELYKFIDAANVDLKGFNEEFYRKQCGAKLKPVLESIKAMKNMGVWIELTNLIIPTMNDNMNEIKKMCEWIVSEVGDKMPLHFSRFFPMYKTLNIQPTPAETLVKARDVAKKAGLKFVYIGNIVTDKDENTYCPKCSKLMVARSGFGIVSNSIRSGKCPYCKQDIPGVWE